MAEAEDVAPDAPSPFVFVVGCPRSGTTLLQRMLDAHPELAVANDTHFIPRAVQAVAPRLASGEADDVPPETHRALIDWARGYHRFPRLGLPEEAIERAAGAETYPEFVRAIYRELAALHGKRLGGEKTPDYVRSLPLLHRLFPRTRILHIVRDGRDVALSALEWAHEGKGPGRFELWTDQPLATCALWWRWQVGAGRSAAAGFGASAPRTLLELRYETLVNEPGEELGRAAAFLGLGDVDRMLAYHEGKRRDGAGMSAKSAWLPPTPGLRDFAREMEPRGLVLFELLAGDLLEELGYRLASDAAERERTELTELAALCRERWQGELARRSKRERSAFRADQGEDG